MFGGTASLSATAWAAMYLRIETFALPFSSGEIRKSQPGDGGLFGLLVQ